MATKYALHVSPKITPQTEPIPSRTEMVENSAGGFVFSLDDWKRIDRFLILGNEGGTYYATERKLTQENAACVTRLLAVDGVAVVARIVEVSDKGRAPKNDPAIFALALAITNGDLATKQAAAEALPKVCRIGTHLFQFVAAIKQLRGWGRLIRRAVANWYLGKEQDQLAHQVTKYQQRDGWSHKDVLRLAHPKCGSDSPHVKTLQWAVKGFGDEGTLDSIEYPKAILAFEAAKRATDAKEVVSLINEFNLPRECVPTQFLTEASVWDALLTNMPMTAMIRNLATMTRVGLLTPLSNATKLVCDRLRSEEALKKARVHPVSVLSAFKTYQQGRGEKSSNTWTPTPQVVAALDDAYYASFGNVTPTGKRWYLGIDVSGSMWGGTIAGVAGLTPGLGAAAMAMVTAATEPQSYMACFDTAMRPFGAIPNERLDAMAGRLARMTWGGTDCSLPMLDAMERKLPVDVFAIYTDSETYAGKMHPCQALQQYRKVMGIPAKLIVVGMTSTGFTIADPNDPGMMDVVGFDAATPQVMSDFASE